jgi:hypothetical protein
MTDSKDASEIEADFANKKMVANRIISGKNL